jgi:diguanylate cyclase (GGDEF)-like protein
VAGQSYFQLISPMIFVVFAGGFAVISHYARDLMSARVFALSYSLGACAFTADFFRVVMSPVVATYLTNAAFLATATLFAAGVVFYYRRPIPWLTMGVIVIVTLAALSWFRLFDDSIAGRTVVMSCGAAAMFATPLFVARRSMVRVIDRFLQIFVFANVLQLALRAAAVVSLGGAGLTEANYAQSSLAISLHFGSAIFALAIATTLFTMFGMKIVTRLTKSSQTDPLTSLLNRRGFDARLDAVQIDGGKNAAVYGFVIADIDHFKAVNDEHGHDAGDKIICYFARVLAGTARSSDIVARWGGEEFVALIAYGDVQEAKRYAEAVRSVFAETGHPCLGGRSATASFGVGIWRSGETLRDVYKRTDEALYAAKLGGRNQVRLATGSVAPLAIESAAA